MMSSLASRWNRLPRLVFVLALLVGLAGAVRPARVAALSSTFVVNTTADQIDHSVGDGMCDFNNLKSGDQCTLRAAVMEANALGGSQQIEIPAGTFTFTRTGAGENSTFTGDLDVKTNLTIIGTGASPTIIDAAGLDRVFDIFSNSNGTTAKIKLRNLALRHGDPGNASGGAIYNRGDLTVENSVIEINAAENGGGIYHTAKNLSLDGTTVRKNTGRNYGGGLMLISGNATVSGSTINGNTAKAVGGGIGNFYFGALFVVNSTISANHAGMVGGGIVTDADYTKLMNTTVVKNVGDADADGNGYGGGIVQTNGDLVIAHSVVALNVDHSGNSHDCSGSMVSDGYNLIGQPGTCTFQGYPNLDLTGLNPKLGPLANNGGPTLTHAPLPTSPLVDAGGSCVDRFGDPLYTDQRGASRPVDATGDGTVVCDIGAHEWPGPYLTALAPNYAKAGSGQLTITVTGLRFAPNAKVRWNGTDRATTFVDAQTLKATILASDLAQAGKAMVTVFNPASGGLSNGRTFVIKP